MRRAAITALVLVALLGCRDITYSPEMTEEGTVEMKTFVPSGHGSGSWISSRGSVVFTNTTIPARYGVVFRCKHGSFAVEGEGRSEAYAVWRKVAQGDRVSIVYREILEDGHVIDLDFLGVE